MKEQSKAPDVCPQCDSKIGIKIPRDGDYYCEDCGWPDEDFADPVGADLNRIAWLERTQVGVSYNVATQSWETDFEGSGHHKTARKAIDAAMDAPQVCEQQKEAPHG